MSDKAESTYGAPAEGTSSSTHGREASRPRGGVPKQVPPDVRLRIYATAELIRVAILGANGSAGGPPTFQAHTEYWRWASSPSFPAQLTLNSALLPNLSSSDIDAFLDGASASNQFTAPQNPAQGDWTQGTRAVPGSRTGYLYWMPDPDISSAKMGVLFEKDNQTSALMAVAWYKKFAPANGLAFNKKIFTNTLTLLNGTNPTSIEPGTWYYILMGTP